MTLDASCSHFCLSLCASLCRDSRSLLSQMPSKRTAKRSRGGQPDQPNPTAKSWGSGQLAASKPADPTEHSEDPGSGVAQPVVGSKASRDSGVPQRADNEGSAVASEIPSGSAGERLAVRRIMQDVRELGRQPREFKNPGSAAQRAETKLAKKVRNHQLKEQVEDMLEAPKRTQGTSSGSPHPGGQVPQSAASTASPTPGLLVRKRLLQKITVLHYDVSTSADPSLSDTVANRGTKRSFVQMLLLTE